jgi:hypothetical protein
LDGIRQVVVDYFDIGSPREHTSTVLRGSQKHKLTLFWSHSLFWHLGVANRVKNYSNEESFLVT